MSSYFLFASGTAKSAGGAETFAIGVNAGSGTRVFRLLRFPAHDDVREVIALDGPSRRHDNGSIRFLDYQWSSTPPVEVKAPTDRGHDRAEQRAKKRFALSGRATAIVTFDQSARQVSELDRPAGSTHEPAR